jgi:periplasmic protein TonB
VVLVATILIAGAVALLRALTADAASASNEPTNGMIPPLVETVYVSPTPSDARLKPQAKSATTVQTAEVPAQTASAVAMPPAAMGSPVRTEPEPTLPSPLAATNSTANAVGNQPNVLGGVMASLDTTRAETVATPKSSEPQRVSEVVIGTPEIAPPPLYPQIAKVARVEGTVELLAKLDKDGRITEVNVVSGHPMLTTAAIDAVKRWRYKPARLNGEPVEAETTVKIKFTLPR